MKRIRSLKIMSQERLESLIDDEQFQGKLIRGKPYSSMAHAQIAARRINGMLNLWGREGFSICSVYPHDGSWYLSRYFRRFGTLVEG